jgi:hypothetical protein
VEEVRGNETGLSKYMTKGGWRGRDIGRGCFLVGLSGKRRSFNVFVDHGDDYFGDYHQRL